jgi:outer membrane protein assembly factor BamB
VVADGVIYWGSCDGYEHATTSRGTLLWSAFLGTISGAQCKPERGRGGQLVRGELVRLNADTGAVQDIFYTVPAGCTGAGVWGSPAVDAGTGEVYFATGNARSCPLPQPMATAVVEVTASRLALVGYWQVPPSEHGVDSDFGSTPTLFTATTAGGTRSLVGLQNKNGIYYAFSRADIAAGPVWQRRIASPGQCPECGRGDISPSAWDRRRLYIGGGNATVNGTKCLGTLRAASPVTGKMIWLRCLPYGAVIGAVTAVPGVVFAGTGPRLLAVNARTGRTLYQYTDTTTGSEYWGAASVSGGVLYAGNQDGSLRAFGPNAIQAGRRSHAMTISHVNSSVVLGLSTYLIVMKCAYSQPCTSTVKTRHCILLASFDISK